MNPVNYPFKYQIRLDTLTDVQKFVAAAGKAEGKVLLVDEEDNCVSAKSLLGAIYTMEWSKIYCMAPTDIYELIREFVL